jgi:hypothetical protein
MLGKRRPTFGVLRPFARAELDLVLAEPLPEKWKDLLRRLREGERYLASSDSKSNE